MAYRVIVKRRTLEAGEHMYLQPVTSMAFLTEDLALECTYDVLEGFRKGGKQHDLLFQIQGPDGFLLEHAAVLERYRKWYWFRTGRMP